MELEREWENLQHGFVVLATAEYLYQNVMQHIRRPQSMRGLYVYVTEQLEYVHRVLCQPYLGIPADSASRHNKNTVEARSVARTLQVFLTLCQARIQLIDLQLNLFTVGDLEEIKGAMETLLAVTEASFLAASPAGGEPQQPQCTAADPVRDALLQELRVWKYFLQACSSLERCE